MKINSSTSLLLDMTAIRNHGIEYYRKNFFWPVEDDQFREFIFFLHNNYIDLVENLQGEEQDIALIDYKSVAELEGFFHYNFVKSFAKENSIRLSQSHESKQFIEFQWGNFSKRYDNLITNVKFSRFRRFFRRLAKNILFNRHLNFSSYLKGLFFGTKIVGIGSYDILKRDFIKDQQIFCNHMDWVDLLSPLSKNSKDINNLLHNIDKKLLTPYIDCLQKHRSYFVKDIDFKYIKRMWLERIENLAYLYRGILEDKNITKINSLLVTELAKPQSRLITIAFQRKNIEVYGFHHGNDIGLVKYQIGHNIGRAHCKKIVVPTKGIAEQFSKIYSKSRVGKLIGNEFISANSSLYKSVNKSEQKTNIVNTVMVMGTPANQNRYIHEQGQFFYSKVDLELSILEHLVKSGFQVTYKAHPDRLTEIGEIFNIDGVTVETRPFEKVWRKADAFIFTDTASTTFGFSLATNKQIFLLNNKFDERDYELNKLLLERINVVDLKLQNDNKFKYSKAELTRALRKPLKNFNNKLFKKILN